MAGRRLVAGAFAVALLSACGFQLRGASALDLKSLDLASDAPSKVATEIRRQLATGPTKLVSGRPDAEVHLRILSESTEKTIRSLTGAGRVFDYLLRLHVGFQATDAAGKAMVEPTELEVSRIITYSESAPLAKEAEEQLLFNDMYREAAEQILRRIAILRAGAPHK